MDSKDQILRDAAGIIGQFFGFALINDDRRFLYTHEQRALDWLKEQLTRDPGTSINAWTADYVLGEERIEDRPSPLLRAG
jgi:hypothetical protein